MQHVAAGAVGVAHVVDVDLLALGLRAGGHPVGRHLGDAEDARQRRCGELDLVEPRDEVTERVEQLLHVEGDGRGGGDRDVAVPGQPPAPQHGGGDGQEEADLEPREPAQPQTQRVALRVAALVERVLEVPPARLLQAEGVHRLRTLDGLGGDAVQPGVGGVLPEVAVTGALEIPARARHVHQRRGEQRDRGQRRDEEGRNRRRDHRGHRDDDRRDAEADDVRERLHVVGRARHEVAGAGPFHDREGQPHRGGDEVLAQPGEDPLGQHERGTPGHPGQQGLHQDRGDEQGDQPVDAAQAALAGGHLLHDLADDPRPDQGDQCGDHVPAEHLRERPAVVAQQHRGVGAHRGARGDRQGAGGVVGASEQRRHHSPPRSTMSR